MFSQNVIHWKASAEYGRQESWKARQVPSKSSEASTGQAACPLCLIFFFFAGEHCSRFQNNTRTKDGGRNFFFFCTSSTSVTVFLGQKAHTHWVSLVEFLPQQYLLFDLRSLSLKLDKFWIACDICCPRSKDESVAFRNRLLVARVISMKLRFQPTDWSAAKTNKKPTNGWKRTNFWQPRGVPGDSHLGSWTIHQLLQEHKPLQARTEYKLFRSYVYIKVPLRE